LSRRGLIAKQRAITERDRGYRRRRERQIDNRIESHRNDIAIGII